MQTYSLVENFLISRPQSYQSSVNSLFDLNSSLVIRQAHPVEEGVSTLNFPQ